VRLCTLGDLLLDVIVRTDGRSGPDAEGSAETRVGAGGQAANVAAWAASLGAEAHFVGKRGSDGAAELAAGELVRRGVELHGPVEDGANGVVVSLVGPDGARTMLSDRGVAPGLRAEELDVCWFGGCEWLHLSGYSLVRRPIVGNAGGWIEWDQIDLRFDPGQQLHQPPCVVGPIVDTVQHDVLECNPAALL